MTQSQTGAPRTQHVVATPVDDGYMIDPEVAKLLRLAQKSLETKVRTGVFQEGVHFFKPRGMRRRWKRSAVVAWLEAGSMTGDEGEDQTLGIPLARSVHGRVDR